MWIGRLLGKPRCMELRKVGLFVRDGQKVNFFASVELADLFDKHGVFHDSSQLKIGRDTMYLEGWRWR